MSGAGTAFDPALTGSDSWLHLDDGRRLRLDTRRWHRRADRADGWLLDRCPGPTLDLGCGPGRLVADLHSRGVPALGVDCSSEALHYCRERRAPAVQADLFDALPAEGAWQHVLLADGNIGIGGDPVRLLRRAASLLSPGGSVVLETTPAWPGLWRGRARWPHQSDSVDGWFPWAVVGPDALPALAAAAGLRVREQARRRRRQFARLEPDSGGISTTTTAARAP
ncbi:class I SAM-dependent methyltransferase [Amycolatopsis sp. OK19-0408]|uniref:Class I SAM-dependent methyltransferase n=1 Tax=Amycolatopsis iheyensis TaxID=2945988 RepID=A0A9X2SRQ9_9PSEU|nr:class I SAM-dependent methyltransferase [Amycolatopsis iheyensis]MCR6490555.1 class I SAM-dependent methyltransferase [Amycolatopsis iheyensis]